MLIAGVEVVLIGELHELYGRPARPATPAPAAAAYLASWSAQRAVDGSRRHRLALLGAAGLRTLRRQVARRMVRNVPTAAPLLLGAALAGRGNRRATETLAERVLRRSARPAPDPCSGQA